MFWFRHLTSVIPNALHLLSLFLSFLFFRCAHIGENQMRRPRSENLGRHEQFVGERKPPSPKLRQWYLVFRPESATFARKGVASTFFLSFHVHGDTCTRTPCVDAPSSIHLQSYTFIHTPDSYTYTRTPSFVHLYSYTFIHTLSIIHLYSYTFNHSPLIILMHFRCSLFLSLSLVLCRWGWMK